MNLPCKFSYNPGLTTIWGCGLLFAIAGMFFAQEALNNTQGLLIEHVIPLDVNQATTFYWVLTALSFGFVLIGVLLGFQRYFNPQVLELTEDAIVLPHGFMNKQLTRISFLSIVKVWEAQVSRQTFFYIATRERKYTIVAAMLPGDGTYAAVRDFITSKVPPNQIHM